MLIDLLIINEQLLLKVSAPVFIQASALLTKDLPLTRRFSDLGRFHIAPNEIGVGGCFKTVMILPEETYYTMTLPPEAESISMRQAIATVSLLGHYAVGDMRKEEVGQKLLKDQSFCLYFHPSSFELNGAIYPWLAKHIRRLGRTRRLQLKKDLRDTIAGIKSKFQRNSGSFEIEVGEEGFLIRVNNNWCGSKFNGNLDANQKLSSALDNNWDRELAFLALVHLNTDIRQHSRKKMDML